METKKSAKHRGAVIKTAVTGLAMFFPRELICEFNLSKIKEYMVQPLFIEMLLITALFFFYDAEIFLPKLKKETAERRLCPGLVFLAALFSFFMVFGESYMKFDSWKLVFANAGLFAVSAVMGAGWYLFFYRLFLLLEVFWDRRRQPQAEGAGPEIPTMQPQAEGAGLEVPAMDEKNAGLDLPVRAAAKKSGSVISRLWALFDARPFLYSLLVMLLCWAVYIAAFYPAILSPDPSFQIMQFFNQDTKYADYVVLIDENVKMTNHHPVAHSVLLGLGIKLGRLFGSDNLGLFFYSLFQILVLGSVLAGTIAYMKKLDLSKKFRLGALLIYSLVPMFPFYAMSAVKDVLFTAWMILYGMLLFDLIRNRDNKISLCRGALTVLLLFVLTISRNNGFHVIVLSFPFLFFVMKGNRKVLLVISACFLVLYGGYFKVLLPGLGITGGSIREALSVPFQQTARYVRDHEEDLTEEDKKVIDTVLGYEDLAERYDPELADPVKNQYNKYTTAKELGAYFSLWFRGLLKHPDTYIQATMNNVYGFFYPDKTNWYLYYKYDDRITKHDLVDYYYNNLETLRENLSNFGMAFPYLPFVGMLSNIGMNTWVLFYLAAQMFRKDRRRYFAAFLPYLATVLICVAAPANTYFRYVLPYVFAMPLLAAFFAAARKEEQKGLRQQKVTVDAENDSRDRK